MSPDHIASTAVSAPQPQFTLPEIYQQPELWPITLDIVSEASARLQLADKLKNGRVLLTGAGTSAYAANSVADAWPNAIAVATTDLLIDPARYLTGVTAVISLARSGNSPESAAVVELVRALRPDIYQLAIVCSADSKLAHSEVDAVIALDPRTNDQSLVMTSSFSNLVMAGLTLAQPLAAAAVVNSLSAHTAKMLPQIDVAAKRVAANLRDRIVVLSSSPLLGWRREAGLKVLEMTAGRFPLIAESYLGLRHGPMSFVTPETLVLCLISSDCVRRNYEADLVRELRAKKIGRLVGITSAGVLDDLFDDVIPAIAPQADDALRTPFEVVTPQLLGYYASLSIGLNPDSPSPDGVISRVVSGVTIYPPHTLETQGV